MEETTQLPNGAVPASSEPQPPLTPEQVFHDYAPRIYNLARRMLASNADAEDVTQDVLLQVVRKLPTFRGEAAFPTWLHRVTVNAALAHRHKKAAREQHHVHDPIESFTEEEHHRSPVRRWRTLAASSQEAQILDRETHQLIEQAIHGLPELYRDIFVLADVEGLPNADIAEILHLTVSAVKSRLHRARLLMRNALAPHFEEILG
jgi:RNA polymerase sigma-70 factor (ECF subfamily)